MNNDSNFWLILFVILGALGFIGFVSWGVHACNTAENAAFGGVDQEIARRNFEKSQAYREGLRRDFDELILAYSRAKSDDERATILSVLRHRVAGAPPEAVPEDVKKFLSAHSN